MNKSARRAVRKRLRGDYVGFLRVAAEYGSSGLWEIDLPKQETYGVGSMIELPEEIRERLRAWCAEYDRLDPWKRTKGYDWEAFHEEGLGIAKAIKRVLGPEWYVEYGFGTEVT